MSCFSMLTCWNYLQFEICHAFPGSLLVEIIYNLKLGVWWANLMLFHAHLLLKLFSSKPCARKIFSDSMGHNVLYVVFLMGRLLAAFLDDAVGGPAFQIFSFWWAQGSRTSPKNGYQHPGAFFCFTRPSLYHQADCLSFLSAGTLGLL